MMTRFISLAFFVVLFWIPELHAQDPHIKIGFTTALTGDAAVFGTEMKNAVILANEVLADGKYEILFEDERCSGASAVSAAKKFIAIDRIDYALGFSCNTALLAVAPIYERAKIPLLSSCATSGDVYDVGKYIFRLFPADQQSMIPLYPYIAQRHAVIGILAEEDAYAQLLKRHFVKANENSPTPKTLVVQDFRFEETDFRTQLLRLKQKKATALFLDSATDATFLRAVQQMHELGMHLDLYGVYVPLSSNVIKQLGPRAEGIVAATLPNLEEEMATQEGNELMKKYVERFGPTQSGFPVVPTTFESFRLVHVAIQSKRPLLEVVRDPKVLAGSYVRGYSFDEHGAIQGLQFILKKVVGGKGVVMNRENKEIE